MYARVATFDGSDGTVAAEDIRQRIESEGGLPPGLPAKGLLILSDPDGNRSIAITLFETEEDYRRGDETLGGAPAGSHGDEEGSRTSVGKYEVALELQL